MFTIMHADGPRANYPVTGNYWPTLILKGWVESELGRPVELYEFRIRNGALCTEEVFITHPDSDFWGVIH